MRSWSALAAALFVITPVWADDDPAADFHKADKALNAAFNEVKHRLSDDANSTARLVKSQRAWIVFRDAECTFQSRGEDGGTIAPLIGVGCRAEMTKERTRQLEVYLKCEEGDLSCPVPVQ